MYNPDYLNWGQQGWICPQCHKTFAPHVSECPYCNAERKTFATTKINITPFDDAGWWDDYMKRTSADGAINIGKDGSISWEGPTPEIHYSTNTGLNVAPCNECMTDWLEAFNEQFK